MEELEHRVLLTNPGLQPVPFLTAGIPLGAAAISPLTRYPTLAVENMQAAGQSVIVPCAGEYPALALAHLAMPQATGGSTYVELAPGITDDGGGTSPILMEGAPRGQGTPNGNASAGNGSGTAGSPNPAAYTRPPLSTGSAPVTSPVATNGGDPDYSMISHWEMTGTLNPNHPMANYSFPVDSTNPVFRFIVQETAGNGAAPAIGAVMVVASTGGPVEQFSPAYVQGQAPQQSMTAAVNSAPNGSHLDLQIGAALGFSDGDNSSPVQSGATSGTGQSSSWSVSFVVDVQRQDGGSLAQTSGSVLPGTSAIGTLVGATTTETGGLLSSGNDPSPAAGSGASATDATATSTALASETPATAEPEPESSDTFNFRVSSGPLASRSASPLGPTLASVDAEATQAVDRHGVRTLPGDRRAGVS